MRSQDLGEGPVWGGGEGGNSMGREGQYGEV